jgi:addiction module HigA family antidote
MSSVSKNRFQPDYSVSPGEILSEALEEQVLSQSDLAQRTGRPTKTINEIIQGKTSITPETAIQLERVLHIPSKFWLNLETNYQSFLSTHVCCSLDRLSQLRAFAVWYPRCRARHQSFF